MSAVLTSLCLGISLAAPVGPVTIEIVKRGLRHGFTAAMPVAIGAALGDVIYLLVTYFGLAPYLLNPAVQISILSLGSLMLLYLGVQNLREKQDFDQLLQEKEKGKNGVLLGLTLAVINPLSLVWWLGAFGAVLGVNPSDTVSLAEFCSHLVIIVGVIIWSAALSLVLHFGKRYVTASTMHAVNLIAGVCLMGFGFYFAYMAFSLI